MTNFYKWFLPLILFFPILFPVSNHADWGSDYAHYLHQAKNITLGISQLDNGFIINDKCAEISPQAYSAGFPLILSIVYLFKGFDVASFILLQTVLLSLIGVVIYFFLLRRYNWTFSILGASLFVFAPYTIWYRNHILSEYAYLLFQMLFLLIYFYNKSKYKWILLGVVLGFAWTIRSAAVAIIVSICLYEFFKYWRLKRSLRARAYLAKVVKYNGLIFATAFFVYKMVNRVIFNTGDNFNFHLTLYQDRFKLSTLTDNFKYYSYELYQSYFYYWQIEWVGLISGLSFLVLLIKGIPVVKYRGKFILWIIVVQLLIVLAFPFQQGTRYVLPIIPLLIIVIINYVHSIVKNRTEVKILLFIVFGLFFYSNFRGITQVNSYATATPVWSPSTELTQNGWEYINENIDDSAIFVTAFPRVLTFYTNKNAYNPCVVDDSGIWDDIRSKRASHIITNTQTNKWVPTLDSFIRNNGAKLDTLYSNSEVTILKIIE